MLVATLLASGCAGFDPRPKGGVTLYGRNLAPGIAWFGVVPLADPPETVGFGSDTGVACLVGPAGSDVVAFDGDPGQGGQPNATVGRVSGGPDDLVMWVDVAADGSVTVGHGVPAGWVGDPDVC